MGAMFNAAPARPLQEPIAMHSRHFQPGTRRHFVAGLLGAATAAAGVAGAAVLHLAPAAAAPAAAVAAEPNAVVHWNAVAEAAFAPLEGTNPMAQSRTLAIAHAAMHDALNAIAPRYAPYTPGLVAAPQASADAAVAAAARDVLVAQLPAERAAFVEQAYARALAAQADGAARSAGIALGQAAARATLARRQNDGAESAAQPAYQPRSGIGEYRYTPPFDFAAAPGWGRVKPFVIALGDHAVGAPLAIESAAYASDFAHVKAIGRKASTVRTAEQTRIAKFWYEDSPLGWNRIAHAVVRERGLDAWDAARAFALVHLAMADGFIAGFDAKYHHRFWRPETAIRAAADDGNARTQPEANWQPLLPTPPVPDHPSTHTVLGWAAAEVLGALFGDEQSYQMTSLTLPGTTRRYASFSAAARENGLSRVYAGIHFAHAVEAGERQGRSVGRAVARALAPLH
jgi:hypothetical protein